LTTIDQHCNSFRAKKRIGVSKVENQDQINQQPDPKDAEKNKAMAVLAYILFLIPLLAAKESKFAMYHTNQGLVLFLMVVAVNVVGGFIPVIGWLLIMPIGNLLALIFAVLGIINSVKGEIKPLPLIGGIKVIKS